MPTRDLIGNPVSDQASVERFRADLERLTGEAPAPGHPLGLAVSGGGDSMALLLLSNAAFPGAIAAATVDHGLRPEAAEEARYVAGVCARLGVPHAALPGGSIDAVAFPNLQERARVARYDALKAWAQGRAIRYVATAHHRDDVAEGFLMKAARGAGVRSLAAMPAARVIGSSAVLLVRPLLGWTRATLAGIANAAGIRSVIDPSNADARFDRARMRRLLADHADLSAEGIARAATNLRDVEEAIEWMILDQLRNRFEEDADGLWLTPDGLPFELRRRFVLRAIQGVREESGRFGAWRPGGVPALVRALEAGRSGTLAEVQARVLKGRWHFRPAPPRRAQPEV